MKNQGAVVVSVIIGILFILVGVEYFTHAANALPHFFLGYDATMTAKHTKHGIAAILLGLLCFVYAWFQSGPKKPAVSAE